MTFLKPSMAHATGRHVPDGLEGRPGHFQRHPCPAQPGEHEHRYERKDDGLLLALGQDADQQPQRGDAQRRADRHQQGRAGIAQVVHFEHQRPEEDEQHELGRR